MSEASVAVAVTSASGSASAGTPGTASGAGTAASKAERAPKRTSASQIVDAPHAPTTASDIERQKSPTPAQPANGAKTSAVEGAGQAEQKSKTESAAPEIQDVRNATSGYGVVGNRYRKPDSIADAATNPKSSLDQQRSPTKEGLDRGAGPAEPPDEYWFPPGATTTRPDANRNARERNDDPGSTVQPDSLSSAPSKGRSESAQFDRTDEAGKGAANGAASGTTSTPNAERDAGAKSTASTQAGSDEALKKQAEKIYIPNEPPKVGQKMAFEGTGDWVRRDLIEYHRHDPVKGRNFLQSMLLIPHNRENAKLQDSAGVAMGDHAFRSAEYAKLLHAARPDILRNYADEKTWKTTLATEKVDQLYGDKLRPVVAAPGAGPLKPASSSADPPSQAKAPPINKGSEDIQHFSGAQHPYTQGRERDSALKTLRKAGVHATFGLAGGYAINKVIDHYSKKPEGLAKEGSLGNAAANAASNTARAEPPMPKNSPGRKI